MHIRTLYLLLFCIFTVNCSGNKQQENYPSEYKIYRFDQELYRYLTAQDSAELLTSYPDFLNEYAEKVILIGTSDSLGFQERLDHFFSEPTLMSLYRDEQERFENVDEINREVAWAFDLFFENFPEIRKPRICMHVSGLNQNVIVTDEFLSLSADKYLGADYPLYQNFFYDYQKQAMSPERMAPDYLLGFMMANFPFVGNEEVLLDRIIHEGKLRYLLSVFLPERAEWEYVGYAPEQYDWCLNNESRIWKSILKNQHLFTPDFKTTQAYLRDAPYTSFLPAESPGRIGTWLGYRIIVAYMKQHPQTTLPQLIQNVNYQELLKQSKYKP